MKYQMMFVILLLGVATAAANGPTADELRLPLQEQLDRIDKEYSSFVIDWWRPLGFHKIEQRRLRTRLNQDAAFRRAFREYLVECCQFAFSTAPKKWDTNANDPWGAGIVALNFPRDILLSAIVPELDPGKRLHRVLEGPGDLAKYLEFQEYDGAPRSFEAYAAYLRDSKDEPPEGLIAYMFRRSPATALSTLMRAAPPQDQADCRAILWAEHVVADVLWKHEHKFLPIDEVPADAAEQLKKLASSAHWWARLYAAEIMRQHEAFRRPEIVERLKQDEHPLVRQAIAAFAEPQPTAAPKDRTP